MRNDFLEAKSRLRAAGSYDELEAHRGSSVPVLGHPADLRGSLWGHRPDRSRSGLLALPQVSGIPALGRSPAEPPPLGALGVPPTPRSGLGHAPGLMSRPTPLGIPLGTVPDGDLRASLGDRGRRGSSQPQRHLEGRGDLPREYAVSGWGGAEPQSRAKAVAATSSQPGPAPDPVREAAKELTRIIERAPTYRRYEWGGFIYRTADGKVHYSPAMTSNDVERVRLEPSKLVPRGARVLGWVHSHLPNEMNQAGLSPEDRDSIATMTRKGLPNRTVDPKLRSFVIDQKSGRLYEFR